MTTTKPDSRIGQKYEQYELQHLTTVFNSSPYWDCVQTFKTIRSAHKALFKKKDRSAYRITRNSEEVIEHG